MPAPSGIEIARLPDPIAVEIEEQDGAFILLRLDRVRLDRVRLDRAGDCIAVHCTGRRRRRRERIANLPSKKAIGGKGDVAAAILSVEASTLRIGAPDGGAPDEISLKLLKFLKFILKIYG
jgi:hypothetical protein